MCDFKTVIDEAIIKFNINKPFNQYYGHIIEKKINDENGSYTVYINPAKKTEVYKINCPDCNSYSNLEPSKYSTNKIPVYLRTKKELELMLAKDYYDKFLYGDIITEKKNPTLYHSINCDSSIITPTISPICKEHLVVMYLNNTNEYYTAYDFYYNSSILEKMYEEYKDLNNDGLTILTKLEAGSLPEVFHYHIYKHGINLYRLQKNLGKLIDNLYYFVNKDEFTNLYIIPVADKKYLYRLNIILYSLRESNDYQYFPNLFFINLNSKIHIVIYFNRVSLKNKTFLNENGNYYLRKEYFNELYGESYDKYGFIYFPFGMIYSNGKNDIQILNKDFINEMKKNVYEHPNFNNIISGNESTKIYPSYSNIVCYGISGQIKDKIELFILEHKNKYTNTINMKKYKCNQLPIIYEFNTNDKWYGTNLESGRIDLDGDFYFFLKINKRGFSIFINNLKKQNVNNLNYYFTLEFQDYNLVLFEPVRTDLLNWLSLDKHNQRSDPNLLNYFILVIYYYIYKYNVDIELSELYVTDENRYYLEYDFGSYKNITTDSKTIVDYSDEVYNLHHYNHNLKMKYSKPNTMTKEKLFKKIINNLHNECVKLNIINYDKYNVNSENYEKYSFLDKMNNYLNNNYKFEDIINWFQFAFTLFTCKTSYYDTYALLAKAYNITYSNDLELIKLVSDKLDNITINFGDFKLKQIREYKTNYMYPDILFTAIGNPTEINLCSYPEFKYSTSKEPTYFSHQEDIYNNLNFIDSVSTYASSRTLRYNICACNDINDYIIVFPNRTKDDYNLFYSEIMKKINVPYASNVFEQQQNILNFILKHILKNKKYNNKNILGYVTSFDMDYDVEEFVIVNPNEHLRLLSSLIISENKLYIATNITLFKNYLDNMNYDVQSIDIYEKYYLELTDTENYNEISYIMEELKKSEYDFYSRPMLSSELILDLKYKTKYLEYKKKYFALKHKF